MIASIGNDRLARAFKNYAHSCASLTTLISLLIIIGWIFGIDALKEPIAESGKVQMGGPVCYLILTLCAFAALALPWRRMQLAGAAGGLLVAFAALVKCAESVFRQDWSLNWTIDSPFNPEATIRLPGATYPDVCLLVILFGVSIFLSTFRLRLKTGWYTFQLVCLIGMSIAVLPLLGYVTGRTEFCTLQGCIKMPLMVSILSMLLGFSILFWRPSDGPLSIFTADTRAGASARRILLLLFVICPAAYAVNVALKSTGWFRLPDRPTVPDDSIPNVVSLLLIVVAVVKLIWQTSQKTATAEIELEQKAVELDETRVQANKIDMELSRTRAALDELEAARSDGRVGQQTIVRAVCPKCKKEFTNEIDVCPDDKTPLELRVEDALVGVVFAEKYKITRLLGRGGMSTVYEGQHQHIDRKVAIKLMQSHLLPDQQSVQRFQMEARSMSKLSHPHIISIIDYGIYSGLPYMVIDLLDGMSLGEMLNERGRITPHQFFTISIQIADALVHAHENGIIHRDIKPNNVMLLRDSDGLLQAKLVDFGLAKSVAAGEAVKLTQTGECVGSPLYMSPEQCLGSQLDARTDIYSLGCVFFESLTGRHAIDGDTVMKVMTNHLDMKPQAFPPELNIPEPLQQLIYSMLQKAPMSRVQNATIVRDTLGQLQMRLISRTS